MGHIIQLHGDPHEQTQTLLPWYVNGTLDVAETAIVEAHLAECEHCRAELEIERALSRQIKGASIDIESGWSAMREKIEAQAKPSNVRPLPFLRRRIGVGWAVAGQLAAAAAVALAIIPWGTPTPSQPTYRALGSAPTTAPGNVIVLFQPDITGRAMREAITGADARVVDGPMVSGAYLLRVPANRRDVVLGRLRSTNKVVLAEPLDAGSPR